MRVLSPPHRAASARWTLRRVFAILAAMAIVATAALTPASSVHANTPVEVDTPEPVVIHEVAMVLDCAGMSDAALEYAIDHGLCTNDRQGTQSGVGTLDVRWGTCGSSHIYVWDQSGTSGRMVAGYGFLSILGTVVYRNLTIGWTNLSLGTVGSSGDSGVMFSSGYGNQRTLTTGNGRIFATLSGTVTLAWGGQCTLLIPSDTTTVLPG